MYSMLSRGQKSYVAITFINFTCLLKVWALMPTWGAVGIRFNMAESLAGPEDKVRKIMKYFFILIHVAGQQPAGIRDWQDLRLCGLQQRQKTLGRGERQV